MPASAELDITEKSHTIRALNSKSSTTDNNKLEQEGLVEPKEITQSGSGSREDERQKAKAQIEEIVNRLMKNPNEPNKAMLTTDDIISVIIRAREVLMLDAALIELEAPIVIVGDLHGQFSDAMAIFSQNGFPPSQKYLFLGDYIDRGEYSTETVVLLLGLKLLHPDSIFLLRGNHECRAINKVYGFYDEVVSRYNIDLWEQFQLTFNCLPICAKISGRIFCMHGGLSRDLNSWQMFNEIRRPCEVPTFGVLCDLLWADPTNENVQFAPSARGISSTFGEEYVIQFCKDLNLDMIVRAHQVVMDGYEFFASRRMVTIFSAPHYCKEFGNSGAVLVVSKDLECRINVRKPKGIIFEEPGNNEEDGSPADTGTTTPPPTTALKIEAQPSQIQDQKLKEKPKTPPSSPLPKASTPKKEKITKAAVSPKIITTEKSPSISPATTPKKSLDDSHHNQEDDSGKNRKKSTFISSTRTAVKIIPTSSTGSSEKICKKNTAASDPTHSYIGGGIKKKKKKKKSGSARQINDRSYKRQKSLSKKNKSDENAEKPPDSSSKKIKSAKTGFEQKLMSSNGSFKARKKSIQNKSGDQSEKHSDNLNDSQKKIKKHKVEKQSKDPEKKTAAEHLTAIQNRSQTPGSSNCGSDKTKK